MLDSFRKCALFTLLLVIASLSFPALNTPTIAASDQLTIVSVLFPRQVPYDHTIPVKVLVTHNGNLTLTVFLYYWLVSGSSSTPTGWRIVTTSALTFPGQDVSVFGADLPSPVFADALSYGMRVVFWVEAVQGSTRISTAQESSKWDPSVLTGKFVVNIVDPYPPTVQSTTQTPQQPTSSDDVLVQVKFAKKSELGANMTIAQLVYSVNGSLPDIQVSMVALPYEKGLFEATIPAQPTGSKVSYRITGIDAAGNIVRTDLSQYRVSPSQLELEKAKEGQAAQVLLLEEIGGTVAAVVVAAVIVLLYRRRTRVQSRLKSLAARSPSAFDGFTVSVILSIAVVGWVAYSISHFGHAWLALVSLVVIVELWGLADPKLGTMFGLFKAPSSGPSASLFEAFRTPGAPLLVSAYTLVFLGTGLAFFENLTGFIDRRGLFELMHFFTSYALIMVGLAAIIRYLSYAHFLSQTKHS